MQTPQSQLARLSDKFRTAGHGLFEFAGKEPTFITRDKGLYAYLIAKPSKRLRKILAVDREILVLISNFEDQQQRTIKTARDIIAESSGRLETTIAVIVHRDPEGNGKLPTWGRAVGIAVLPVFSENMPGTPVELEKHLAYELFSYDPFDVTGPVSDDANFFGRRNEAQDLARKLQCGQIRSCLGIRKIGKTSILNRIIYEVRQHHNCSTVVVDCSRDEIWKMNPDGLMTALAAALGDALASPERYVAVSSVHAALPLDQAAKVFVEALEKSGRPVIIFIDEVDYITPGSPTTSQWTEGFNRFWRNFRAVYQEASRRQLILSVMVCGVSSKWFSVGAIAGVENAALAFIPEEYLSPLARNATIAMILKTSRSSGLIFSKDVANAIAAYCSDMPFWVRKACSYIHRHIDIQARPLNVAIDRVQVLMDQFVEREGVTLAQVAIEHLFRVYPELEAPCLDSLGEAHSSPSAVYTTLRRYGLLAENDPIRPSGPMVKQALQGYQANRSQMSLDLGVASTSGTEGSLSEWADDLAVINKERNILEKRMRNLVLNFIKLDNIQSKQRGASRDRILASTPADRRAKLNHLSPDEAIEQLMWRELAGVTLKEWPLFSSVFGDRRQFENHIEMVNARYDAHAKEVDELEIAAYRRSVKWLSERIASI